MHYLVTGGLGFIGAHLCHALRASGHDVTILDDCSSGSLDKRAPGAALIEADLCHPDAAARGMQDVDGCFHLAAIASVERSHMEWVRAHEVNLGGTLRVFNAAVKRGVPVVYASSAAVYGTQAPPLSETLTPMPLSAYGADKYACELHAQIGHAVHGLNSIGLRFFNVYGPGQMPHSPYSGVISRFAAMIAAGETLTLHGDGAQTRDFIYVDDVVQSLTCSMQALHDASIAQAVFNICTGIPTRIDALAGMLADIAGTSLRTEHAPARAGDIRHSFGDPAQAHTALGFTARIPLAEGLAHTFSALRAQ